MAMTTGDNENHAVVTAWLQRVAQGDSVEALVEAFEVAFAALWRRSYLVLGEVTLTAIVERVLHNATEQYPFIGSVEVGASGLNCQGLRSGEGLHYDRVAAAVRFVLVEFLTVLGNLTAQILTPALHAELSRHPAAKVGESGTNERPAP